MTIERILEIIKGNEFETKGILNTEYGKHKGNITVSKGRINVGDCSYSISKFDIDTYRTFNTSFDKVMVIKTTFGAELSIYCR